MSDLISTIYDMLENIEEKSDDFFFSFPNIPSQEQNGIHFDFCNGVRLLFAKGANYHVVLLDNDTGDVIEDVFTFRRKFESKIKFYVNWGIRIYDTFGNLVLSHDLDLKGRETLFYVQSGCLGDNIAWPVLAWEFAKAHGCKGGLVAKPGYIDFLSRMYQDMTVFSYETAKVLEPYAAYSLGVVYDIDCHKQCYSVYGTDIQRMVAGDLGLGYLPELLKAPLVYADIEIPVAPYVCVATQASSQRKCWNNPDAIRETVAWLKAHGYRVLCIDRDTDDLRGMEDFTGNKPIEERSALLKHARCFIGLPSGLSWLAWAAGCKVVMISGFSEPWSEFYTPYRVQNIHACHGCWNDPRCHRHDYEGVDCPRGMDFECTRKISSKMVIDKLKLALEIQ